MIFLSVPLFAFRQRSWIIEEMLNEGMKSYDRAIYMKPFAEGL